MYIVEKAFSTFRLQTILNENSDAEVIKVGTINEGSREYFYAVIKLPEGTQP
jgi:hypothetical protein